MQEIELLCPAGFTAIAGGVTSDDGMVLLNEVSFDLTDPTGVLIGVTYLGTSSAQCSGVATCAA